MAERPVVLFRGAFVAYDGPEKPCRAVVGERPHYIHKHRCNRRASWLRDGYPVCGTHAKTIAIEVPAFPQRIKP